MEKGRCGMRELITVICNLVIVICMAVLYADSKGR